MPFLFNFSGQKLGGGATLPEEIQHPTLLFRGCCWGSCTVKWRISDTKYLRRVRWSVKADSIAPARGVKATSVGSPHRYNKGANTAPRQQPSLQLWRTVCRWSSHPEAWSQKVSIRQRPGIPSYWPHASMNMLQTWSPLASTPVPLVSPLSGLPAALLSFQPPGWELLTGHLSSSSFPQRAG